MASRRAAPEPPGPLLALAKDLFEDESERARFVEAVHGGGAREQALILRHDRPEVRTFPQYRPEAWQAPFVIRLRDDFRPGLHPLHAKGAYYVLDFSSIFAISLIDTFPDSPRRILDLCAAPGGKSVYAWRRFGPEQLIANEVQPKRLGALVANLERLQIERSVVTGWDPSRWGDLGPMFDLVIVDAPCSGQSLLAKGSPAEGAFADGMIDKCVGRERRIAANAARALLPGGYLLYSTCTYTTRENERVIEWLLKEFPNLEAVEVPGRAAHRSPHSLVPTYRLFPQEGLGAGAFAALLRHTGERPELPVLPPLNPRWSYGQPRPKGARSKAEMPPNRPR